MNRPPAMQDMGWLLSNFADSVAGIAHVVAVSADGLLLAQSRDLPPDRADQLAAITSGVVSLTEGAARMFSAGGVLQTVLEMDSVFTAHAAAIGRAGLDLESAALADEREGEMVDTALFGPAGGRGRRRAA